jgi:hypothetical protein
LSAIDSIFVVGPLGDYFMVLIQCWIHPLFVDIPASFFLEYFISFQIYLKESLVLKGSYFHQIFKNFYIAHYAYLIESKVQVLNLNKLQDILRYLCDQVMA